MHNLAPRYSTDRKSVKLVLGCLLLLGGSLPASAQATLHKDLKKDFEAVGEGRTNDQTALPQAAAFYQPTRPNCGGRGPGHIFPKARTGWASPAARLVVQRGGRLEMQPNTKATIAGQLVEESGYFNQDARAKVHTIEHGQPKNSPRTLKTSLLAKPDSQPGLG